MVVLNYYSIFHRQKRTVNSKKYGVDLVHFTHAKNTAIHASTKVDGRFSLGL